MPFWFELDPIRASSFQDSFFQWFEHDPIWTDSFYKLKQLQSCERICKATLCNTTLCNR
jgi:hypothetical protein